MVAKRTYQVRVISGSLKGRLLAYPNERSLRPTMQRTKASLFDSLGDALRGAVFIDLYAAAGAMGIEAISRGVAFVHFVERERRALELLRKNLDTCGIGPEKMRVHPSEVFEFLNSHAFDSLQPDVVYADPPYGEPDAGRLVKFFDENENVAFGLLIVEHEDDLDVASLQRLVRTRLKKSGQTRVSFFEAHGE